MFRKLAPIGATASRHAAAVGKLDKSLAPTCEKSPNGLSSNGRVFGGSARGGQGPLLPVGVGHSGTKSSPPRAPANISPRGPKGAARLETLDRGAPVSIYTVARELGHGSDEMVKRICSHLGDVRHRDEVVEYTVEQHLDRLGDRLQQLGFRGTFDTGKDTVAGSAADATNPDSTEVLPGQKLPESGRPDSNRRRPAWEASDPSVDERPPA
jgi:hypothetical protein